MSDGTQYIGKFSFARAIVVTLANVCIVAAVLFTLQSAIIKNEGGFENRLFFIIAIPVFLIMLPGVFYKYCGRPLRRAVKFDGNFSRLDRAKIEFCSGLEAVSISSVDTVILRRRRPKGRLYWLQEAVLVPVDTSMPETVVGLFYLKGNREKFVSDLAKILYKNRVL
ncbi:hypothetical protein GCM10009087_04850 [Sphingomonas oligophenolica]|uniref:PH domain-containing protein n=1 Tax=Sphingomonas oligophenolica TaxID=301154 RepID=A0ABU9YCB2_9SPHN